MKEFRFDNNKNELLKAERDISFEEILIAIDNGKLIDILEHRNKKKYKNQKIFVVEVQKYAYLVPFVENDTEIFLKTIIPSRKATRIYLINKKKS